MAAKVLPQNFLESLAFLALTATVALCEELLYRGFVFAAIERATSSAGLAAAGSAFLFALAHLYQGKRGVRTTFFVGLLFAVSRIWTGSIAPTILAHLVVDLLAGLLAPRWLRNRGSQAESGADSETQRQRND
jgi:membrane protease YdiL (CAAX protease family)